MGRPRTQIGLCTTPECFNPKVSKGKCSGCYQKTRKKSCPKTSDRHSPLKHTITETPSGVTMAKCQYCDQGFVLQPSPQP